MMSKKNIDFIAPIIRIFSAIGLCIGSAAALSTLIYTASSLLVVSLLLDIATLFARRGRGDD